MVALKPLRGLGGIVMLFLFASQAHAEASQLLVEECMQEAMLEAGPTMTVGEIEEQCRLDLDGESEEEYSAARERLAMEQRTEWNPFVITPHLSNYILPYTYVKNPNQAPYESEFSGAPMKNEEVKLQISLKVPLNSEDLFIPNDGIYFAFTLKAFWQLYNHSISAPFRETNYRPELFYFSPLPSFSEDSESAMMLGFEHESNGRSQLLSRSWNRLFLNYFFAKDNYLISFRPWYRLPEEDKEYEGDPDGDDNPDIYKYMGYFELMGTWEQNDYEFSLMLRNNLNSPNYGAVRFDASFPLWGRVRGLVQYFNGYGESLIDYNHRNERIGIGILLTDML